LPDCLLFGHTPTLQGVDPVDNGEPRRSCRGPA
jgi:hypothetical protein